MRQFENKDMTVDFSTCKYFDGLAAMIVYLLPLFKLIWTKPRPQLQIGPNAFWPAKQSTGFENLTLTFEVWKQPCEIKHSINMMMAEGLSDNK